MNSKYRLSATAGRRGLFISTALAVVVVAVVILSNNKVTASRSRPTEANDLMFSEIIDQLAALNRRLDRMESRARREVTMGDISSSGSGPHVVITDENESEPPPDQMRTDLSRLERILDKVSANQQSLFEAQRTQEEAMTQTRELIRSGFSKILVRLDLYLAANDSAATPPPIRDNNGGLSSGSGLPERITAVEEVLRRIEFDLSGGSMPCSNEHERTLIRGLLEDVFTLTTAAKENITHEVAALKNSFRCGRDEVTPCPDRNNRTTSALSAATLHVVNLHINTSIRCLDRLAGDLSAAAAASPPQMVPIPVREAIDLAGRRAAAVAAAGNGNSWTKRTAQDRLQEAVESLVNLVGSSPPRSVPGAAVGTAAAVGSDSLACARGEMASLRGHVNRLRTP